MSFLLNPFTVAPVATWRALTSAPSAFWMNIACSKDGLIILGTYSYYDDATDLYPSNTAVSHDGGATWTTGGVALTDGKRINGVCMSDDGVVMYAMCGSGYLYKSTNSGQSFTLVAYSNTWYDGRVACSADGSRVIATCSSGQVRMSTNFGVSFSPYSVGIYNANGYLYPSWGGVACSADGAKALITGSQVAIGKTTNGGSTWVARSSAVTRIAPAVDADMSHAVVAEDAGYLSTSADGGETWTQRTALGWKYWRGLAMSETGAVILAAPSNGEYLQLSTDGGETWVPQTSAGARSWRCCALSADGSKAYAAMASGALYSFG